MHALGVASLGVRHRQNRREAAPGRKHSTRKQNRARRGGRGRSLPLPARLEEQLQDCVLHRRLRLARRLRLLQRAGHVHDRLERLEEEPGAVDEDDDQRRGAAEARGAAVLPAEPAARRGRDGVLQRTAARSLRSRNSRRSRRRLREGASIQV